MPRRTVSTKELRAECDVLERAVLTMRAATKDALIAYRPGGGENPDRGAWGWVVYLRYLSRCMGMAAPSNSSRRSEDAEVLDALRAEPIAVKLVSGRTVHVYPKSLDALLHVHALDAQLSWLTAALETARASSRGAAMDTLTPIADTIATTYHLLAAILLHPGPGMPYATEDPNPSIPDEIRALEPWDVVRICTAHHKHLGRLAALSVLIDRRSQRVPDGRRPSWSAFVGAMALEMGESPSRLMKHHSLAELLASAQLSADAKSPREEASS